MGEPDALIFLADVALHNQSIPGPTIFHKKKDSRPKELKIINSNGSSFAEINDLKNFPMSAIFKIFVEKFEDTSRRCTVYVCKFGLRNGCNMKFMDVKENRIHRLENLIQCHLLEHLLKTKSGSFIEIPKRSIENIKTNTVSRSMTEIDNSSSDGNSSRNDQNSVKTTDHRTPTARKRPTRKNIRPTNGEDQSLGALPDMANYDHTYATSGDKKSINSSEEPQLIKSDININELLVPGGERSDELSSFMMYETLHQPTNIFIIDGTNLIVEKLPIVGSEVEVSTNYDVSVTKNFNQSADKIQYTCTFCTASYMTKKSLSLHIRKKHSDSPELKPAKRKIVVNEDELVTHDSKAGKMMPMPQTSETVNNDWFVDLKENMKVDVHLAEKNDASILKTALTKNQAVKRPIINISNVWNNIHVQYV